MDRILYQSTKQSSKGLTISSNSMYSKKQNKFNNIWTISWWYCYCILLTVSTKVSGRCPLSICRINIPSFDILCLIEKHSINRLCYNKLLMISFLIPMNRFIKLLYLFLKFCFVCSWNSVLSVLPIVFYLFFQFWLIYSSMVSYYEMQRSL